MNRIIFNSDKSIKELEKILTTAGWADGAELRFDQIKAQAVNAPIFYRATSPSFAPAVFLDREGEPERVNLFLTYNPISAGLLASGNRTQAIRQAFTLSIQYNDAFLFWLPEEDGKSNKFLAYLDNLLELLEHNLWVIGDLGEMTFEAKNDGDSFVYHKLYRIEKIF